MMSAATTSLRPISPRRRAMRLGYLNGALWSIGNGLTTGTLIIYLAMELGARGVGVSLVLAIPALAGLLRVFTPLVIRWFGDAKRACLATCLLSYTLLLGLPVLVVLEPKLLPMSPLKAMLALLCVHQLLEYVGTVALWSWLADLIPVRIRGRYFGQRQIWQLAVLIPTLALSGTFADRWRLSHPDQPLFGYAIPNAVGAVLLLASLAPLVAMPARLGGGPARSPDVVPWRSLIAPLGDARFCRLLWFGCWFSFFNGLTQAPQNIFPKAVLGLGLLDQAHMRTLMQLGQMGVSWLVGPWSDRYGNRPVLIASQLLVASGPLFFLIATPEQPYWIGGAWIVWAAYAGINVCLPNLMLKLSEGRQRAAYVGTYFAITSLCYAASTVAGGLLLDRLLPSSLQKVPSYQLNVYRQLFYFGWVSRSVGVIWLCWINEPGAWSWRRIFSRRRSTHP
jgi:MFS transporter